MLEVCVRNNTQYISGELSGELSGQLSAGMTSDAAS